MKKKDQTRERQFEVYLEIILAPINMISFDTSIVIK